MAFVLVTTRKRIDCLSIDSFSKFGNFRKLLWRADKNKLWIIFPCFYFQKLQTYFLGNETKNLRKVGKRKNQNVNAISRFAVCAASFSAAIHSDKIITKSRRRENSRSLCINFPCLVCYCYKLFPESYVE